MGRGSGGQNRVFNLASDTWHVGVVSKGRVFQREKKNTTRRCYILTLHLLEGKKPTNVFQGKPKCHILSLRCN